MPLARGYIAAERSELHPKTSQIMHGQPDTLHLVLPFFPIVTASSKFLTR